MSLKYEPSTTRVRQSCDHAPRPVSTVTQVHRGSTFALRRSTLDFCLAGQRSLAKGIDSFGDVQASSYAGICLKAILRLFPRKHAKSQQLAIAMTSWVI